jgi:molybdate transport system ATP-binding protein
VNENVRSDEAVLHIRLRKHLAVQQGTRVGFEIDLEFTASTGFTVIFGPSGAGKTTLLELVAGLVKPDFGRISFHQGQSVHNFFDSSRTIDLPIQHRRLGYVFQTLALFPHLSVAENVEYGLHSLDEHERGDRVSEILDSFRISHLAAQRPERISGGERQRVALARSLVTHPRALLLDEPLSALDYNIKSKIISDLLTWNCQHRIPVLYVTHAIDEAFAVGDRAILLDQGHITADGSPAKVLADERTQLIQRLSTAAPL